MNRPSQVMAVGAAVLVATSAAAVDVDTVALFNPAALETPESVQIARDGAIYVGMALTGEIRRIAPDGTQSSVVFLPIGVNVQPCGNGLGFAAMGSIALDHDDNIYAAVLSCNTADIGVWKVTPQGSMSQLAQLGANAGPNGLAYRGGYLYASDTLLRLVWRVSPDGTQAPTVWSHDPQLAPPHEPVPLTPGPNGVQVFRDEIYVAVSDRAHVVAFPIQADGSAGPGRVHVSGIALDDFSFDVKGNLYGTTDPSNKVVRIAADGTMDVLLTVDDGLDGPTATAFGVGSDKTRLYVTNAAFPFFDVPPPRRPSLLRIDVGVPSKTRP